MLNFLGVSQNLSVLAETPWSSTFLFRDEVTEDVADLDGVTFEGWVMVLGNKRELRFTRSDLDGLRHLVQVTVPKLPEGRWQYEIFCAAETGEKNRLVNGYITAEGGLDSDEGETYENRTLEVSLPGDATRRIRMEWKATTIAILAANEARAALTEIKKVEVKLDGIDDAVQDANDARDDAMSARDEARDIVDAAPRQYIPDISSDGYWILNGVKTAYRAVPKDGENGADAITVVRHRIADVSELPSEGSTCSGGHLYYVEREDEPAGAVLSFRDGATLPAMFALAVNGVAVSASTASIVDAAGVPGLLLNAIMDAGIEGLTGEVQDGKLVLTTTEDALTVAADTEGLEVVESPRHVWGSCPCYAWCIDEDGAGSWMQIDGDGMMTAGTGGDSGNSYTNSGAGWKEKPATTITRGTVLMGTDEVLTGETSPVGKDEQGRMCVDVARTLGTATYTTPGAILLGSQFDIKCDIPYLLSITADQNGRLMQNLVPGGALKHMQRQGWQNSGTVGLSLSGLGDFAYTLGLHTSRSFRQSLKNGLEIVDATNALIGGVTLTDDINDDKPAHVLGAPALKALLDLVYYTRTQVDKKLEGYIEVNDTLFKIKIMKQEDYDKLAQIDAHTLYLTY